MLKKLKKDKENGELKRENKKGKNGYKSLCAQAESWTSTGKSQARERGKMNSGGLTEIWGGPRCGEDTEK